MMLSGRIVSLVRFDNISEFHYYAVRSATTSTFHDTHNSRRAIEISVYLYFFQISRHTQNEENIVSGRFPIKIPNISTSLNSRKTFPN